MKLTSTSLSFASALLVISAAQKFVIPVPTAGAEALLFPSDHEKAGEPITDWKGNPIEGEGIVFFNGKDSCYQAAKAGGGVVIINQVTEAQAAVLAAMIGDIEALDVSKLKEVLAYARTELGLVDQYNSDKGFIASKMTPVKTALGEAYGHFKRDDRDICKAIRVEGSGEYEGPAATPQQFTNGAVFVEQTGSIRLIQPDIFIETYTTTEAEVIDLDNVPLIQPEEEALAA